MKRSSDIDFDRLLESLQKDAPARAQDDDDLDDEYDDDYDDEDDEDDDE